MSDGKAYFDMLEKEKESERDAAPLVVASKRGVDWMLFSRQVLDHIENYTVPQYGDKGEDQASEFKSHDHVVQAKKYLNRYGKNSRPGQEILDLMKTAHYCQMAAMELAIELKEASDA